MTLRLPPLVVQIRPADFADQSEFGFVLKCWLRTHLHDSEFAQGVPHDLFFREHEPLLKRLLARSSVACAVDPESPSTIFGWIVYEPPREDVPTTIHFAYVKSAWRHRRVAAQLAHHAGLGRDFVYTHRTKDGEEILKRYPCATHDPYRLFQEYCRHG